MNKPRVLLLSVSALLWFSSRACDECSDGLRRCHPVREEVEVCADGEWTTEENCYGENDCCLENDEGTTAECAGQCWTSSCETEPIGS